jgi:hypothetical protein
MPKSERVRECRSCALGLALLLGACATAPPAAPVAPPPPAPAAAQTAPPPEVQCRADADRARALEIEVDRLRADVRAAEETLLAVESGMRGAKGRAQAVSALAEARIQVERAVRQAPWRADVAAEARAKLAEADRQLAAGHIGSAVFFVSRAARIAESLAAEGTRVASDPHTHFVRGERVNLRARPSADAEVLGVLDARLPVFVEGGEGDWSLVRTATGRVGFVRSDLLGQR